MAATIATATTVTNAPTTGTRHQPKRPGQRVRWHVMLAARLQRPVRVSARNVAAIWFRPCALDAAASFRPARGSARSVELPLERPRPPRRGWPGYQDWPSDGRAIPFDGSGGSTCPIDVGPSPGPACWDRHDRADPCGCGLCLDPLYGRRCSHETPRGPFPDDSVLHGPGNERAHPCGRQASGRAGVVVPSASSVGGLSLTDAKRLDRLAAPGRERDIAGSCL